MSLNFNLNSIITFIAVAEASSFRAAADHLHTSQSAVSARVRQLEERLGVRLFHRTTRLVSLTDEGRQLFTVAKSTFADIETVAKALRKEATLQSGEITIASVPSVAQAKLPSIMAEFRRRHPGMTLRLLDIDSDRCLDKMSAGEADLAIVSDLETRRNMIFEPLFWDECFFVAPRHHPLAQRQYVRLSDIAAYELMLSPKGTTLWSIIEQAFLARGIQLQASQQTWNMSTLLRLIEEGFGIGVIPEIAANKLDLSRCKILPLNERIGRTIGVARMAMRSETPGIRAFRKLLHEHYHLCNQNDSRHDVRLHSNHEGAPLESRPMEQGR
ncbi:MAG: LysR substrate-binding domain-containing protein [Pusillimonas sp.]